MHESFIIKAMRAWFESIEDDSEKRALYSVPVGIVSVLLALATFLHFLAYPLSVTVAIIGLLMAYSSLDAKRGWHAVAGMVLNAIGLLLPLTLLAILFLFAR